MSIATTIAQVRERAATQWLARTEQERRFLAIGGAVVLLAILYLAPVDPAVEGRRRLAASLPQLRQQAAELQAMARREPQSVDATAAAQMALDLDAVEPDLVEPRAGGLADLDRQWLRRQRRARLGAEHERLRLGSLAACRRGRRKHECRHDQHRHERRPATPFRSPSCPHS